MAAPQQHEPVAGMMPRRPNPVRSLRISVIAQWVLAAFFLVPGIFAAFLVMQRARLGDFGWVMANITCAYLAPGILHGTCAIHIARRRQWAFTLAGTLCGIYMILLVFMIVLGGLAVIVPAIMRQFQIGAMVFLVVSISLFIALRWISAVLDDACRVLGLAGERGFQPVMPGASQSRAGSPCHWNQNTESGK